MKSAFAYSESELLAGKNKYAGASCVPKKSVDKPFVKQISSEARPAAIATVERPDPTTRILTFWRSYSCAEPRRSREPKIAFVGKLNPLQATSTSPRKSASLALKRETRTVKIARAISRIHKTAASSKYDFILNEYQHLVDLELRGSIRVEGKIKKKQIEAELDAIEAKEALESGGVSSYKSDIEKLEKLIALAKEIRTLI